MLFLPQNQARQRDRLGLPNPSCWTSRSSPSAVST